MDLVDVERDWLLLLLLLLWLFLDSAAAVVVVIVVVVSQLIQTVLEQLADDRHGVRQAPPVHLLNSTISYVITMMRVRRRNPHRAAADADDDDGDGDADEGDVGTRHRYVVTISAN